MKNRISKAFRRKIEDIQYFVDRMKIYKSYRDIPKSERKKVLESQFLIENENGELLLSGGGRVLLFLSLTKGSIEKELDDAIKQRNLGKIEQNLIFQKSLKFFGYSINYKINPNEVLKDK